MKRTIINGIVTGFHDSNELPTIELIHYLPFNGEWNRYSYFIESDGAFQFEIEQLFPVEIMMIFEEMFSIYTFPGDSIYVTIDARILSDTSNMPGFKSKYIQIECPNQRFQDEYQGFSQTFFAEFQTRDDYLALKDAQTNLDHTSYAEYIKQMSTKQKQYLDKYIVKNKPSKAFQIWADNWLYLQELEYLLRYPLLHTTYNKLDRDLYRVPDSYFDFLKDERHNDEKLLASLQYQAFLQELYMHLNREFSQSEMNSQFDTFYKAGKKSEAYDLLLKHIIENSTGFEQEYFVSKFFSMLILWKYLEVYDVLYDPILISREDYIQVLAKEYTDLKILIENPFNARNLSMHQPDAIGEDLIFPTLPEKYPDKVIYLDFWAPWCGPCMAEMPKSRDLQEKLHGKDIVFVFLASQCSEESWKATVSERKLSGEHFLLTEKEYALLAGKFDIAGIPRYMIIDKKGLVVNNDAPRPSAESLEGLLVSLSEE